MVLVIGFFCLCDLCRFAITDRWENVNLSDLMKGHPMRQVGCRLKKKNKSEKNEEGEKIVVIVKMLLQS